MALGKLAGLEIGIVRMAFAFSQGFSDLPGSRKGGWREGEHHAG